MTVRVTSKLEDPLRPQLAIAARLSTDIFDAPREIRSTKILALIDTGASKSCVSPAVLDILKAERWEKRTQKTASGEHEVYQRWVHLELFDDDTVVFFDQEKLQVLEYAAGADDPYQMLLGMDVISKFKSCKICGFDLTFEM